MKRLWARFLLCLVPLLPAPALTAQELTGLLLEFGTVRGALVGLLYERPPGASRLAFRLADLLALNPDRKSFPYLARISWGVSPALRYEGNVNGGIGADVIYFNDLPFIVEEGSRAISAMTLGLSLQSDARIGIGRGSILSLGARGEWREALGEDFSVAGSMLSLGLSHTFGNMAYLQGTAALSRRKTDFDSRKSRSAGLSFGRLWGNTRAIHDFSLSLLRVADDVSWQSRIRADWSLARRGYGHFTLSLEKGAPEARRMRLDHGISLSWSDFLQGRATTLHLSRRAEGGGTFRGLAREDRLWILRLERQLSARANGYLSLEKRDSSEDLFRATTLSAGFVLRGLRF